MTQHPPAHTPSQSPRPRAALRGCLAACALAALMMTGCTSDNTHEFQSRIYQPLTVSINDPARQAELWTYDIPTQHLLVLDFNRRHQHGWGNENELFGTKDIPATHLKWRLYRGFGKEHRRQISEGVLELPGSPFVMSVTVRPTPELPPDETPLTPPAQLEPKPMPEDTPGEYGELTPPTEPTPPAVYDPEGQEAQATQEATQEATQPDVEPQAGSETQSAPATQPE